MVTNISRRDFMKLGLLASVSLSLWACSALPGDDSVVEPAAANGKKVIIIGAGIAGLAAARNLIAAGYEVQILEGRDRIGGRIHTNRDLGFSVDLGASWIHGVRDNPITELAKEFDIATMLTDYDDISVYDQKGAQVSEADLVQYLEAYETGFAEARAYAEELDQDISLQQAIDWVADQEDLNARQRVIVKYMLFATIESDYAEDTAQLSAWWFDDDDEFSGDDHLFLAGYDQIIANLADGVSIQTGQTVEQIAYDNQGAQIKTSSNQFDADYLLVTVPLGVLKANQIQFSPGLPEAKLNAIQRLGMGVLNKTVLKFFEPFWPVDRHFFGSMADPIGENSFYLNLMPFYEQPALLGFSAGSAARDIETRSDDQIINHMMENLRTIFGGELPEPESYLITRWDNDPFSLGSYSYIPVGATPEDRQALAESVKNVLFFAGEATHNKYPATVHGAFLSGVRAAEEISTI